MSHRLLAILKPLAASCLLLCAACGGSGSEPNAAAPSTPESSPSTSAPVPSSTTAPEWRTKFSSAQLTAYDEATARFAAYESRSEPVWAAGKVTPEAKALFQEFFPSPAWQIVLTRLKTYEEVEVQVDGIPEVVWSKASRIDGGSGGSSVTLKQCADYTAVSTSQYGRVVGRDAIFEGPVERTAVLKKSGDGPWLIYDNPEPTAADAKPCTASDDAQ